MPMITVFLDPFCSFGRSVQTVHFASLVHVCLFLATTPPLASVFPFRSLPLEAFSVGQKSVGGNATLSVLPLT